MDSVGSSNRPSSEMENFGTTPKPKKKRRYVSRGRSEQGRDTAPPQSERCHPSAANLSREERIQLYMSRIWENPEGKEKKERKGNNNLPLNVFSGEEYTEEELKVEE